MEELQTEFRTLGFSVVPSGVGILEGAVASTWMSIPLETPDAIVRLILGVILRLYEVPIAPRIASGSIIFVRRTGERSTVPHAEALEILADESPGVLTRLLAAAR